MQLGMIGLGRMGANMARRLQKAGHQCVVFDRNAESVKELLARDGRAWRIIEEEHTLPEPSAVPAALGRATAGAH